MLVGMILCNNTIRYMLLNQARAITFSCAPSFPMVASIRVGYKFLMNGETQEVSLCPATSEMHNVPSADPFLSLPTATRADPE